MAFKIALLLGFVSLAPAVEQGRYISESISKEGRPVYIYPAERATPSTVYQQEEYQQAAPVAYDFNYQVHDEHTGDIKSQKEVRNGDTVQGRYELIDSDGYRRIVEYTADSRNGFIAVVHREPVDIKIPQPIPQDPKLRYLAPVIKDIPVQAYPVQKVAFDLPKYSAAQFSPTVASVPRNPALHVFRSDIASAPAYRSPVHSAPLSNGANQNQDYQSAYLQRTNPAPVNQNYNSQAYSLPVQGPQSYSDNKYNTIPFSSIKPVNEQYVDSGLIYNTRPNNGNGYQPRYYDLPLGNNYYSQSSDKLHSLPLNRAVYSDYVNVAKNYYSQDQNRISLDFSRYNQVPTVQTKLVAPISGTSAQQTKDTSELQKSGANQNDYTVSFQQEQGSTNSDSKPNQSESFGASTTPSYNH